MWDRVALYGSGLLAGAALLWLGFLRQPLPEMEDAVAEVMSLTEAGTVEEARALIDDLMERFPEDVRGLHLLAWFQESQGDLASAQDSYRESLALCPNDDLKRHVMLCIADIDRRSGESDRARRYLALAVERYGESKRSKRLAAMLRPVESSTNQPFKDIRHPAEKESGNGNSVR